MQARAHPKCLLLQASGILEADPESSPLQGLLLFLEVSWFSDHIWEAWAHPSLPASIPKTHTGGFGAGLGLFYFAFSSLKLLSWAFSYTNDTYKKIKDQDTQ